MCGRARGICGFLRTVAAEGASEAEGAIPHASSHREGAPISVKRYRSSPVWLVPYDYIYGTATEYRVRSVAYVYTVVVRNPVSAYI